MITDHSSSWQAHLEHISDYILLVWWKKIGNGSIEFFDGESHPNFKSQGPSRHHFRSTNFEKEVNYLKECWEKCMENKQQIPLPQLRIPDCDGNMVLTRNIINEEEADDGMNSGGDEGDIVMVEKVVVSCGDRVVSLGNDGDKATDGIGSLFCEDKVDGDSVACSGEGNWQGNGDENGISAEGLQGDAKKDDEPDREPDVDKNVISFKESTGTSDFTNVDDTGKQCQSTCTIQGKLYYIYNRNFNFTIELAD